MADPTLVRWGKNIERHRLLRNSRGEIRQRGQESMSQAELGAMLEPPVSQATVSRWESGLMEPRRIYKTQIADALSADAETLFPLAAAVA